MTGKESSCSVGTRIIHVQEKNKLKRRHYLIQLYRRSEVCMLHPRRHFIHSDDHMNMIKTHPTFVPNL